MSKIDNMLFLVKGKEISAKKALAGVILALSIVLLLAVSPTASAELVNYTGGQIDVSIDNMSGDTVEIRYEDQAEIRVLFRESDGTTPLNNGKGFEATFTGNDSAPSIEITPTPTQVLPIQGFTYPYRPIELFAAQWFGATVNNIETSRGVVLDLQSQENTCELDTQTDTIFACIAPDNQVADAIQLTFAKNHAVFTGTAPENNPGSNEDLGSFGLSLDGLVLAATVGNELTDIAPNLDPINITVEYDFRPIAEIETDRLNTSFYPVGSTLFVTGTPVFFQEQASVTNNGTLITDYNWSVTPPSGSPPTVSQPPGERHFFNPQVPGQYTVTLTVIDDSGTMGRISAQQTNNDILVLLSGDVDENGSADSGDINEIVDILLGSSTPTPTEILLADIDFTPGGERNASKIDSGDINEIIDIILGL
jgi:hypothetical protein